METEDTVSVTLHPPNLPWRYKPGVWDHEELHREYHERRRPGPPPDDIAVALLDTNGEKTPLRNLKADHESDKLELEDAPPIHFVNFRYMTTNCAALCRDHVADHRFIIMVSVRRWENIDIPEECYVHNFFIQPESAEQALDILDFFQFHLYEYLKKETKQSTVSKVLEFNRPQLLQDCTVKIHWRKLRKTWTEKRTIVLDPECVIFYRKPFDDAHEPRDRMFFWFEQFRKSVSKVALIKSQNCILLHSLFMYIVLQYDDETCPEIEAAIKKVKPVPRKAFREPEILFHWLEGNYDEIKGQIRPPAPPEPKPLQMEEEETQKLDQFEKALNEGLYRVSDDQSQMIWNNMRPFLEQALVDNKVPKVNEAELSANCNPNSVDSLLQIVSIIEDQLFCNVQYEEALGTTIAMKNIFEKSQVERLRQLMDDSPVDILHKIHARGNNTGKRSRKMNTAGPEDDDILDEDLEEEESAEEEEMEDVQELSQWER